MTRTKTPTPSVTIRCAIYTRKSTEEGLEQEFNSLDAQRESGEAFIRSQQHEGWTCVPTHYDDGGYSGGNADRPALKRLLADIEAGKVDCVVVYKVDRLSRSLLDFARMMEVLERHQVSFVSVTQQFSTTQSMGRLTLNILLSFAQFEREIISERTRDKIAATRRKGKWAGGHPILGYDIDPQAFKLVVNAEEAQRVRSIFELYSQLAGLIPVVQELARRGWSNKRWTTRKGPVRGGKPFCKTSLHKLLTNVVYTGKVRYKTEIHEGEHEAIVDPALWQRVQATLGRNGRTGGAAVRNKFGALLKGLIHCVPCHSAMAPSHTTKQRTRQYRYYVCTGAQKHGWQSCPSKSVPAGEIERFIIDQIRCIGQDPSLLHETIQQAQAHLQASVAELANEQRLLQREVARWNTELRELAHAGGKDLDRLAEVQERLREGERRMNEVAIEIDRLERQVVQEDDAALALSSFDPVWATLTPREQCRVMQLLIERVDYNGATGKVAITFCQSGIKSLASEWAHSHKETA